MPSSPIQIVVLRFVARSGPIGDFIAVQSCRAESLDRTVVHVLPQVFFLGGELSGLKCFGVGRSLLCGQAVQRDMGGITRKKTVEIALEFCQALVGKGEHQIGAPGAETGLSDLLKETSGIVYAVPSIEKSRVLGVKGLDAQGKAIDSSLQQLAEQIGIDGARVGLQGDFRVWFGGKGLKKAMNLIGRVQAGGAASEKDSAWGALEIALVRLELAEQGLGVSRKWRLGVHVSIERAIGAARAAPGNVYVEAPRIHVSVISAALQRGRHVQPNFQAAA